MLVVLLLMAGLGGLALGAGRRAMAESRTLRARAELEALSCALDRYRIETGDYPRTASAAALLQSLIGRRGPLGNHVALPSFLDLSRFQVSRDPFTDAGAELLDPWGNAYRYAFRAEAAWTNPRYVLYSLGADGAGTETLQAGGFALVAGAFDSDNVLAAP